MSEWKTVRLGELFELQMGKTPDRKRLDYFGDNGNKWISIADISKADKYITETKECITDEAVNNSGIKQIPANTLIMSFKLSIGKTAITTEPMYSNEAIMAFLPNGKYETDNDFLYHLFSNKDWSEGSNKAVKGITLNKASLSEAKIPLPPLETQKHIAAVLNKCTALIAKHREMLTKYDTLIKSRFIEMFGDNQTLEFQTLENICSIITDGTHQPPKFTTTGIPFLFVSNIAGNKITYETEKFISEKTYEELYKRTPIEIGDVLLSTVGSYGHPAIVETDNKFLFQRHIAYLKPKKDLINSIYFHGALLSPDAQKQIEERVKGIAQKTLNLSEIRKIKIPVPPLELQNDFAAFVQQIDKSKFAVQKSLEKTEILYKSLMQTYFG